MGLSFPKPHKGERRFPSSSVAKLIRAPCFLPLNASRARRLTSLSLATSSVTVFISTSPPQHHSRNLLIVFQRKRRDDFKRHDYTFAITAPMARAAATIFSS